MAVGVVTDTDTELDTTGKKWMNSGRIKSLNKTIVNSRDIILKKKKNPEKCDIQKLKRKGHCGRIRLKTIGRKT